jgi:hypothetical protein
VVGVADALRELPTTARAAGNGHKTPPAPSRTSSCVHASYFTHATIDRHAQHMAW